ncbi:MAG TPA: BrnT family toxin, partial [Gammaproteobacteria bacterium]
RWVVIGKIDEKYWSAVMTRRGENIRLISVRRSRDEEVAIYESEDEGDDL